MQPWKRRLRLPGQRFKDLKYKAVGLPPPAQTHIAGRDATPQVDELLDTSTSNFVRETRRHARQLVSQLAHMSDLSQRPVLFPKVRKALRSPECADEMVNSISYTTSGLNELRSLTEYDYGARITYRIQLLLAAALHPGRPPSLGLGFGATPAAYNILIAWFLATDDIPMARMALDAMRSHGVALTRETYHAFLAHHARRCHLDLYKRTTPLQGHPLRLTCALLKEMDSAGVNADAATWNLAAQCMPPSTSIAGSSTAIFIEEMSRRRIPITRKFSVLPSPQTPLLRVIDDTLVSRRPNNANIHAAVSLLSATHERSTEMLNMIWRRFAARKRVDCQFGILTYFSDTSWDVDTWQLLLEGASGTSTGTAKWALLGTILMQAQRENIPLTPRARYLARRALRQAPASGLLDYGAEGWKALLVGLKWSHDYPLEPVNPALLSCIGYRTGHPNEEPPCMHMAPADLKLERFPSFPRTDTRERRAELARLLSPHTEPDSKYITL